MPNYLLEDYDDGLYGAASRAAAQHNSDIPPDVPYGRVTRDDVLRAWLENEGPGGDHEPDTGEEQVDADD